MAHYLQSLLGEREKILLATRHHWFILATSIFVEVISILIIFALTIIASVLLPALLPVAIPVVPIVSIIGFILLLFPIATGTRDFLNWSNHQFIITNRRVMQISGIFNKNVIDSSLEKVNDIKMSQSALGRMFGYGDIEILTASELGVNLFKKIADPVGFKTALVNAKAYLEQGAPVAAVESKPDVPVMIAKLAELRAQGVLSEEEFQQKKTELLAKM
jgi:uncharacterized membrane protein YdbT with pleckstrin-like domain